MIQGQQFRLFKAFGITIYLHWSWFIVAAYELQRRSGHGGSLGWAAAEYIALFGLVLLHEFGHSLACRQVGGSAHDITLWPLGGVAFVSPPPRAGALLWSIAAGPLVNLVLAVPLTLVVYFGGDALAGWPGLEVFVTRLWGINLMLFGFNMLPIYPLDGGQILRSLLWFPFGRVRSLWIASVLGIVGAVALVALAFSVNTILSPLWTAIIAVFILMQCGAGFKEARRLKQLESIPRHRAFLCPGCKTHPLQAPIWVCGGCQHAFDPFLSDGTCPSCGMTLTAATCPECREPHALELWGVR